ncbi:potassium channel family protein [Nocardia crassostreae]|uniref:potassium channel family protein n=1 Tax=Nocardia crassostreae TaxID=53428 RepID=UPI000834CF91|nr:potassium channel protein [Nocardia crassostreae]
MNPLRRLSRVVVAFVCVVLAGTAGYVLLGFGVLDALYQTVTTITTVGFREVHPLSPVGQVFTMALILVGAGTVFYMFGLLLEALIEGHLRKYLERRRMDRRIDRMRGHVIVCGWGRVGRSTAQYLHSLGETIVVIDKDPQRLRDIEFPHILGDVTDDSVLAAAGIEHARALIAALDSDADNVYVTLSSRALRADLAIVARARTESSKAKLVRAGANRAVNPQLIGGRRMAAFALQPNVAEFLDVVMHEDTLEYRIEEIPIGTRSSLAGHSLTDTDLRRTTGALVLALRTPDGRFVTNPTDETQLHLDTILIVLGTPTQLDAVRTRAGNGFGW